MGNPMAADELARVRPRTRSVGRRAGGRWLHRDSSSRRAARVRPERVPARRAVHAGDSGRARVGRAVAAARASRHARPRRTSRSIQRRCARPCRQPPMLHRFKETLPRWISSAARRLASDYDGDASRIWPRGSHVIDVTERLSAFDGIGRKKAVMAVEILLAPLRRRACTGASAGRSPTTSRCAASSCARAWSTRTRSRRSSAQRPRRAPRRPARSTSPRGWSAATGAGRSAPVRASAAWQRSCARRTALTPEGVGARGRARELGGATRLSGRRDRRAASGRSTCSSAASSRRRARPRAAGPCASAAARRPRRARPAAASASSAPFTNPSRSSVSGRSGWMPSSGSSTSSCSTATSRCFHAAERSSGIARVEVDVGAQRGHARASVAAGLDEERRGVDVLEDLPRLLGGRVAEIEVRSSPAQNAAASNGALGVGDSVRGQHDELRVVHVDERHHDEVVGGVDSVSPRGGGLVAPEVAVGECGRVAVVTVGDEDALVGERGAERRRAIAGRSPPTARSRRRRRRSPRRPGRTPSPRRRARR